MMLVTINLERSALLVVFVSFLATLCKEQGSTVLLVCLLYDFILKNKLAHKVRLFVYLRSLTFGHVALNHYLLM